MAASYGVSDHLKNCCLGYVNLGHMRLGYLKRRQMKQRPQMKKFRFLPLLACALAALSLAQAGMPAPSSAPQTRDASPVASGTLLSAELSKSLDAKKCKVNDRVEAKIATDFLAHGQIVVPRNTKIIGHVTEAKAHSKQSPDSTVGITFDRMQLKDGHEVPFPVAVQAVGRPLQVWSNSTGGPSADNPAGAPVVMPGQQVPTVGANPGTAAASPYPGTGDPGAAPGPMATNNSGVGTLNPNSHGVVGIKGLSLDTAGPVSVLSSNTGNVHLDGGSQLILRVQ